MKRATKETYLDKDGNEQTRFWVWRQGRRCYMKHEPGPKTEANKQRRRKP